MPQAFAAEGRGAAAAAAAAAASAGAGATPLPPQPLVVAPTELRQALAGLGGGDFSEYAMHDASEALLHLYNLLHDALAAGGAGAGAAAPLARGPAGSLRERRGGPSVVQAAGFECRAGAASAGCLVHSHFGMEIEEEVVCPKCTIHSHKQHYAKYFHIVSAPEVRGGVGEAPLCRA